MEQTTVTRNPIADPMRDPMANPIEGFCKTLIARTDGRTDERVSHLLKKPSSYVLSAKNQGNSPSISSREKA